MLADNRKNGIRTWRQFARKVRVRGCELLNNLDAFNESVLVAGCQRSGTTMLARIITGSDGMTEYRFGKDDELDAGLILSGAVAYQADGRYCFQTTYLNECYGEYFQHPGKFRLIWVIRNPASVVYSLVHNWKRFALNELFDGCGKQLLTQRHAAYYKYVGRHAITPLRRACLSYVGKVSQVFELQKRLGSEVLMVVDYDELVSEKEVLLPEIYEFIELPYVEEYAKNIRTSSLKKSERLTRREKTLVDELCVPVYEKARHLVLRP